MRFKARTGEKLADTKLQVALRKLQGNFVRGRADRILELDNFGEIRTAAAQRHENASAARRGSARRYRTTMTLRHLEEETTE